MSDCVHGVPYRHLVLPNHGSPGKPYWCPGIPTLTATKPAGSVDLPWRVPPVTIEPERPIRPLPDVTAPFGSFTEEDLWDAYDNDPRAHALVHFLLTRRRWCLRMMLRRRGRPRS